MPFGKSMCKIEVTELYTTDHFKPPHYSFGLHLKQKAVFLFGQFPCSPSQKASSHFAQYLQVIRTLANTWKHILQGTPVCNSLILWASVIAGLNSLKSTFPLIDIVKSPYVK